MGILARTAETRKMLERRQNARPVQPLAEGESLPCHKRRVGSEEASRIAEARTFRRNPQIHHRGKIHVDAESGHLPPGTEAEIAHLSLFHASHGLGGRQGEEAAFRLQTAHPAAFLIHGHQKRARCSMLKRRYQRPELCGRFDVVAFPRLFPLVEKDDAADAPPGHGLQHGRRSTRALKARHDHGTGHFL